MEKDIAEGKIGNIGSYDVEFKEGKLKVSVLADFPMGSAGLSVQIGAEQLINAIEKAIPGQLDDAALELLKKFLLGA